MGTQPFAQHGGGFGEKAHGLAGVSQAREVRDALRRLECETEVRGVCSAHRSSIARRGIARNV